MSRTLCTDKANDVDFKVGLLRTIGRAPKNAILIGGNASEPRCGVWKVRYDGEENCRYDKIIFQRRSDPAGDEAGCFGEREECCMNEMMMDLDPLVTAETWRKSGREVAIATVIETWGSAPRPAGSHLVIDSDANFEGSVSGGCVEGAVISEALDVISTGEAKMLEFGVADETAWRVGLSCGGRIRVYVERLG